MWVLLIDLLTNCIYPLTCAIYRMSFGMLPIQTHIGHSHLIAYIQTTLGYLATTCGRGSRHQSLEVGAVVQ